MFMTALCKDRACASASGLLCTWPTPSQRRNGADATAAELQATAVEEPGQETAMEKLRRKSWDKKNVFFCFSVFPRN